MGKLLFFIFFPPNWKAKPTPGVDTCDVTRRRTWQGMAAQGHDAAHRQRGSPITLLRKNALADNNWMTFKRFCLHIAKNTFDYGFYSPDETGAPSSSPRPRKATCGTRPGLGEGELLRGTQNHTQVSKGILKELIERQRNRNAHLQLLHLWRQMSVYSGQEQTVPFGAVSRVGQNISSRIDFVLKSGLGEEIRVNTSWPLPVTYQTNQEGRKEGTEERGEEGRKQGRGGR